MIVAIDQQQQQHVVAAAAAAAAIYKILATLPLFINTSLP